MQNVAPLGGVLLQQRSAAEFPMIEVQGLTKEYGRFRAVDDLSFRVAPGEVLGFLGPNGAGKTTTMRIVAGFLPPTAGRVLVCGADIETQAVAAKRRIGYLPEGAPSYPEMTPRSFLEFIAEARGIAPASAAQAPRRGVRSCCISSACSSRPSTRCRRAIGAASGSRRRSCTIPRC